MSNDEREEVHIDKAEKWHVDKGIPLALLVGLAVQGAYFAYGYGSLDTRVSTLEERTNEHREDNQRLTIVETDVKNVKDDVKEIKDDQKEIKRSVQSIERSLTRRPSSGGGR